jgi:hypothetical protein
MGKRENQKEFNLDPEKLARIREGLSKPQPNVVETLEDLIAVAEALGKDKLVSLLEKELYAGYTDRDVPSYRTLKVRGAVFVFKRPLKDFHNYHERRVTVPKLKDKVSMIDVMREVVNGIERTAEWREFKKDLYRESLKYVGEKKEEEKKGFSIDLSGLKNE